MPKKTFTKYNYSYISLALKRIDNTRLLISQKYEDCYTIDDPEFIQPFGVKYFTLSDAINLLTEDEQRRVFFNMDKLM